VGITKRESVTREDGEEDRDNEKEGEEELVNPKESQHFNHPNHSNS
jgi:hypothetical protein